MKARPYKRRGISPARQPDPWLTEEQRAKPGRGFVSYPFPDGIIKVDSEYVYRVTAKHLMLSLTELQHEAARGRAFLAPKKRSPNYLYRAAAEILKNRPKANAHEVLFRLKKYGVVLSFNSTVVSWHDPRGRRGQVRRGQFAKRLSEIRRAPRRPA